MWRNLLDYGASTVLGGAGLALFCHIAFHWRATCRWIDGWEARRSRFWGHSEKYIAFNKLLTPVYLVSAPAFLFVGSVALLTICGAPLVTLLNRNETGMRLHSDRFIQLFIGAACYTIGGAIIFRWRAVCRFLDATEARKRRDLGYSSKNAVEAARTSTPIGLIFGLFLLFFVGLVFMLGFGWQMMS